MIRRVVTIGFAVAVVGVVAGAQTPRPASPRGSAEVQIGGPEGKWIEITYGRPLLRGRTNVFGAGAEYGQKLYAGAPVWRAGADVSTRLKTELPLNIGNQTVSPGEYSLFVDLKENNWTLIVSSWAAKPTGRDPNKEALWGAYDYTPAKDVARVAMKVERIPISIEQLTWGFVDVTPAGGRLVLWWENTMASAPFTVGP
ncbi:MAG: DUF2911 domain-containing protein [Acidobacteria bacterium]|nr:DUF2911 domain-containing protein [Acidobacteriota bacterium]MCA1651274.1 DUF2911 domain-containing protein [Acidobacteriota bacterium]